MISKLPRKSSKGMSFKYFDDVHDDISHVVSPDLT